jgi:hypothetical protein
VPTLPSAAGTDRGLAGGRECLPFKRSQAEARKRRALLTMASVSRQTFSTCIACLKARHVTPVLTPTDASRLGLNFSGRGEEASPHLLVHVVVGEAIWQSMAAMQPTFEKPRCNLTRSTATSHSPALLASLLGAPDEVEYERRGRGIAMSRSRG